jgi:triphosphoribosyl-dephospho-CoA synthase
MPSHILQSGDLPAGFENWLAAIPTDRDSIGWQASAACLLESAVFKPGNVHPGADFLDLAHEDFVNAALAIALPFNMWLAPASQGDPARRFQLGQGILAAVEASIEVTQTNANLGMVLAIAPLAASSLPVEREVGAVLTSLKPADAAAIWQAIRTAQPGGLGRVDEHDLAGPPPENILHAMRLAADRDAIARLWAEDYAPLFASASSPHRLGMVPLLEQALTQGMGMAAAIQLAFLQHLAHHLDSLIVRRHGHTIAEQVSKLAAEIVAQPLAEQAPLVKNLDEVLRAGRWSDGCWRPINPGTTADLVAAALFVLLRRGWTLPTT